MTALPSIDDLRDLLMACAASPWEAREGTVSGRVVVAPAEPKVRFMVAAVSGQRREANAALIALAPALAARVIELEAKLIGGAA